MVNLAPFIVLIGLTIITIQENHILDTTRTIYHSKPGADYITTRARGSQAKRFPSTKVLYTLKGTSTFQFKRNLRTCGDIDPIPGPEKRKFKPKYPCGECRRTIRRNQDTILCARCNILSHTNCLKLSKSSLNYYQQHPERDWVCSLCSLPDYNESVLNNSTVETNLTATDLLSTAENMQVDIRQLRGNNKKEWIIANLNIKSLPNKFVKIQERLTSNWIDFLSVQETKIDGSFPNTQFHVDAYNLFPRDRTKGGSGIAVFIWDTIVAPERNKTANNKNLSWSTCNRPKKCRSY